MITRPLLLAALVALAATAPADDPPPAKAPKANFSASVTALNIIFKRDTGGTVAKKYIGREVTVRGRVKGVAKADRGGQTLTLSGLPPTADDPSGCSVLFPAGHPSLGVVKGLSAGAAVQIRGTIEGVTGTAFTLKSPTLVGRPAGPVARGPAPAPKRPVPRPGVPAAPVEPETTRPPASEPYRAEKQLPKDERTMPAVELSRKLLADKSGELQRRLRGQVLELTGVVRSCGPVEESIEKGAWSVNLVGAPPQKGDTTRVVFLYFRSTSPALPRVRNLGVGDEVTVRGLFEQRSGGDVLLRGEEVVTGGDPRPALAPARHVTAEDLFKEVAAGPGALKKVRGQAVAVTGSIDLDPVATQHGLKLSVRYAGAPVLASVECAVDRDQLDAVRQLPPGHRVKVVGVIALTEPERNQVWLGRCRVSLLDPNPMLTVSVDELVAAYRDNNKAAGEKYGNRTTGRWLYLTGEVAAISTDKQGLRTARLKGPAGPRVLVGVSYLGADQVKVGQAVRVKAECQGALPGGFVVKLWGATILPEAKTPLPLAK